VEANAHPLDGPLAGGRGSSWQAIDIPAVLGQQPDISTGAQNWLEVHSALVNSNAME
jgi:hypothetical protein